jgi:colanic acid biosynthesis protein WcaH
MSGLRPKTTGEHASFAIATCAVPEATPQRLRQSLGSPKGRGFLHIGAQLIKVKAAMPRFLSHAELDAVIRLAPLIAIDLIIRNARGDVLLGLRKNEPAKGCYFVPGGMILKDERLGEAFARLMKNETDHSASFDDARLVGVFEHFYTTNRSGRPDYGTHYVVLGYEYKWPPAPAPKPDDQHSELRWWAVAELLASDRVHENTKAYFRPSAGRAATGNHSAKPR